MLAEVFGSSLMLVSLIGLAVPLWAIVDAFMRPATAFYAAGSNKTAWIAVLLVTTFLGLGIFLGLFYLIGVRGKVRRAGLSRR